METAQSRAIYQLIEVLYQTQLEKAMIVCDQIEAEKTQDTDPLLLENRRLSAHIAELIEKQDQEMDELLANFDMATRLIANRNQEIDQLETTIKESQVHYNDLVREIGDFIANFSSPPNDSDYPVLNFVLYGKVRDAKPT